MGLIDSTNRVLYTSSILKKIALHDVEDLRRTVSRLSHWKCLSEEVIDLKTLAHVLPFSLSVGLQATSLFICESESQCLCSPGLDGLQQKPHTDTTSHCFWKPCLGGLVYFVCGSAYEKLTFLLQLHRLHKPRIERCQLERVLTQTLIAADRIYKADYDVQRTGSQSSFFNVTFVLDVLLSQLFTRTQEPDFVYMKDLLTWASDNDLDLLVMSGHASDPVTPQVMSTYSQKATSNSSNQNPAYKWSRVSHDENERIPPTRTKHACCLHEGCFYMYGGKYGPNVLNDLWRFDIGKAKWELMTCRGDKPRLLQEHTLVAYKQQLYVFGGEFACNGSDETPLWILDLDTLKWRKYFTPDSDVTSPLSTRGHTAVVYNRAMYIYGGYMDHRGSSDQLWLFDFEIECWHLASSPIISADIPEGRYLHSAVVHDGTMWVYGGMTDLQYRGDLWTWNFRMRTWARVKFKQGPPELKGHTACKVGDHMYIFGGESNGLLQHDTWKFHFGTHTWQRIVCPALSPSPYSQHCAVVVPRFLLGYANATKTPTERVRSVPSLQSQRPPVSKRPATSPTTVATPDDSSASQSTHPPTCPSPRLFKNRIQPTDPLAIHGTIYDSLECLSQKQKHCIDSLSAKSQEDNIWYEQVEMLPVARQQSDDDGIPLIMPQLKKSLITVDLKENLSKLGSHHNDKPVVQNGDGGRTAPHPKMHHLLGIHPGLTARDMFTGSKHSERSAFFRQYSSTDELISETSLDDMLPLVQGNQIRASAKALPGFDNPNYRSESSLLQRELSSGSSRLLHAASINSEYVTTDGAVTTPAGAYNDSNPVPLKKRCSAEDLVCTVKVKHANTRSSSASCQSRSSSHIFDPQFIEQSIYKNEECIPGFVRSASIDSLLQDIGGVRINYIRIGDDGPWHFVKPQKAESLIVEDFDLEDFHTDDVISSSPSKPSTHPASISNHGSKKACDWLSVGEKYDSSQCLLTNSITPANEEDEDMIRRSAADISLHEQGIDTHQHSTENTSENSSLSHQSERTLEYDFDTSQLKEVSEMEVERTLVFENQHCVTHEYETTKLVAGTTCTDSLFDGLDPVTSSHRSSQPYPSRHLVQKETGFSMFILGGWEPEAIHILPEPLSVWKLDIS